MAGKGTIMTKDPENIKAILATQFNDFALGTRYDAMNITLGAGIFTLDGDGWKHSRAMLRPQFAREQVGHVTMLEPHVQALISRVKEAHGQSLDLQKLFFQLTIDAGTEFLFGESCESLRANEKAVGDLSSFEKLKQEFPTSFNYAQDMLFRRAALQSLYFIAGGSKFKRSNEVIHAFADYYVQKALHTTDKEVEKISGEGYVFLYELLGQTRDPKLLRDQCLNILLAARDTTAGLLSFTFYELARNPEILNKLRQEIYEAFGDGEDLSLVTFESLKKCEYLKWVLNEALRMYPSVPTNFRVAQKNTTLPRGGGPDGNSSIFVPKGTSVAYSTFAMHREPEFYGEDSEVYRPERWGEPEAKKYGWAYVPFNGGPRICLGQQFALTEASYVTVRLLQTFKNLVAFDMDYPPAKLTHLTMSLANGCNHTKGRAWYGVIAFLFVAYVALNHLKQYIIYRRSGASLPPRTGDYILGFKNVAELIKQQQAGTTPEYFQSKYSTVKGKTFRSYMAGTTGITTKDPENIKALLATQFNDFALGSTRYNAIKVTLGDGIFTLDGNGWKHSRAMLRPQFARDQVGHVASLEPHIQALAKRIRRAKGSSFDLQPLFFELTIDTGTEFLFGESCDSLSADPNAVIDHSSFEKIRQNFSDSFNYSQNMLFNRVVTQGLYFLRDSFKFRRSNLVVHAFTDHYVQLALNSSEEDIDKYSKHGYVFLYELAKQTRDPKVLRDQCLNILLAARDTTAGLLSFTFYELARNPEILNKLRQEIYEAFGDGEDLSLITFESLKKCEYLKWVLNEALRMYPSVPTNFRVAQKNTTLPRGGGPDGMSPIFIPKGASISYTVYATHRDPEYYGKDAETFRPERWGEPEAKKYGWAFVPFNGGPRVCLGQQFALTEASYTTVRLLQLFKHIESFDSQYPPLKMTHLTMSLFYGCNVSMT
ncbi:CIC11C00000004995 [Sungouiella intermedia]|uniref:CIC11C00000004995 n=1 Tax=Sungouiella intermedia TaxID=45354 RepID=A0A1L0GEE9_9ASCO|nr:CIC11C00000004995 [[Candida] intermedia]